LQRDLTRTDPAHYGVPRRSLIGHAHYIEDVVVSSDGQVWFFASLCLVRFCDLCVFATVCHVGFLGRHVASVGSQHRCHDQALYWPQEGRLVRCVQRGQSSDCLWISRQDHQALEHPRRVQVDDRGSGLETSHSLLCSRVKNFLFARDTLNGFLPFVFRPTPRTPSWSAPVGMVWSRFERLPFGCLVCLSCFARFGTCPTASCARTWPATRDTSTV
jgi:hypothetical protein